MRNPEGPKALQDKTPSRKADPMPEIVRPDSRMGDPTANIRRLLADADFQVGGEARTRWRRESWSGASSGNGAAFGGVWGVRRTADLGPWTRNWGTAQWWRSGRRKGESGRDERAHAISEAESRLPSTSELSGSPQQTRYFMQQKRLIKKEKSQISIFSKFIYLIFRTFNINETLFCFFFYIKYFKFKEKIKK